MLDDLRVGHWTDAAARTGCTVVLCPSGTTACAEVRGGAPASRELELLAPERTVQRVDAVLLTGGSAFGLAAADGVMAYCEANAMGVMTPAGRVPIVPTLALYDLHVGDATLRPHAAAGRAACEAARAGDVEQGRVGAGTGATVRTSATDATRRPGGLVVATATAGPLTVRALVAVNAAGFVNVADGAGTDAAIGALADDAAAGEPPLVNTTIGVVATNARLDKLGCLLVAQGAHDGLSRAVTPPHTRNDGDAFVALATGTLAGDVAVDSVRLLALAAVERAIRSVA